jgi:hypothetical membrane protein
VTTTDRTLLWVGVAGVLLYVGTWFTLGFLAEGYDPLQQAISELFDLGAPAWQRWTLASVLAVTGVALIPFGATLDRVLPGHGRLGPLLVVIAGVGTLLVAFFPCTDGCPPIGSSFTDTMHVVLAGGGYVGLVTAPLAFAWRLRATSWRGLALAGLVLGGVATVGFVVRNVGVDVLPGLQQRVFNTLADGWYLVATVSALRRHSTAVVDSSGSGAGTSDGSRSTPETRSSSAQSTP